LSGRSDSQRRLASRILPTLVPALRLCHNVILRLKPKNLSFITHRFYEILHGVHPEPKPRPFASLRVTHCEGFRMTNLHFKIIATQSLCRGSVRNRKERYSVRVGTIRPSQFRLDSDWTSQDDRELEELPTSLRLVERE
jgi:hypothetical protein